MPRLLPWIGVVLVASACLVDAEEVVVFKKESRYKGAAMRVAKVELDKQGRLLITSIRGELLSAAPADVDWETSKRMTESAQKDDEERRTREAEEQRKREARSAISSTRRLSVLEASMLYGVDQPAFSTPEGSAYHQPSAAGAAGAADASAEASESTPGPVADTPAMKKTTGRLEGLTKQRAAVDQDLTKLKADTNPDPVSAGLRSSRIEEKTRQLASLDKQLESIKAELDRLRSEAQKAAAEKAKKAEKAAATAAQPSPTPPIEPPPEPEYQQ